MHADIRPQVETQVVWGFRGQRYPWNSIWWNTWKRVFWWRLISTESIFNFVNILIATGSRMNSSWPNTYTVFPSLHFPNPIRPTNYGSLSWLPSNELLSKIYIMNWILPYLHLLHLSSCLGCLQGQGWPIGISTYDCIKLFVNYETFPSVDIMIVTR